MATVSIVTEVTLAELNALVAENGLNEGLQYKVTDKGWLLLATSENTYKSQSIPYRVYAAILSQNGTDDPNAIVLANEIGDIVWSRVDVGFYTATLLGAFPEGKTIAFVSPTTNGGPGGTIIKVSFDTENGDYINVSTRTSDDTGYDSELSYTGIEIRVYQF